MKKVEKDIANNLRNNIRYLASLIPRQVEPPPSGAAFLADWAATPDEAFSLYTDTIKVNFALSLSEHLASQNWPFPAYINLRNEFLAVIRKYRRAQRGRLGKWRELRRLKKVLALTETDFMSANFRTHSRQVFERWKASPLFKSKLPLLAEIELACEREQWAVCLPAVLPLLDFLIARTMEIRHGMCRSVPCATPSKGRNSSERPKWPCSLGRSEKP